MKGLKHCQFALFLLTNKQKYIMAFRKNINKENASPFTLWSPNQNQDSSSSSTFEKSLFDWRAQLSNNGKSEIFIKINVFRKKPYVHFRKVMKGSGKSSNITLEASEFHDLFAAHNVLAAQLDKSIATIKQEYGSLVENDNASNTEYVTIPKSQRSKELEESNKRVLEDKQVDLELFEKWKKIKRSQGENQEMLVVDE